MTDLHIVSSKDVSDEYIEEMVKYANEFLDLMMGITENRPLYFCTNFMTIAYVNFYFRAYKLTKSKTGERITWQEYKENILETIKRNLDGCDKYDAADPI